MNLRSLAACLFAVLGLLTLVAPARAQSSKVVAYSSGVSCLAAFQEFARNPVIREAMADWLARRELAQKAAAQGEAEAKPSPGSTAGPSVAPSPQIAPGTCPHGYDYLCVGVLSSPCFSTPDEQACECAAYVTCGCNPPVASPAPPCSSSSLRRSEPR